MTDRSTTTIRIPDDLKTEIAHKLIDERTNLNTLVVRLLRKWLAGEIEEDEE